MCAITEIATNGAKPPMVAAKTERDTDRAGFDWKLLRHRRRQHAAAAYQSRIGIFGAAPVQTNPIHRPATSTESHIRIEPRAASRTVSRTVPPATACA